MATFNKQLVCARSARVVARRAICREHVALELALADFPTSQPGQFIQAQCANDDDNTPREVEWPEGRLPQLGAAVANPDQTLLRRPFSIADRWENPADGQTHLLLISRAVGRGTRWLDQVAVESQISITGPLGKGFTLPTDARPVALVGGGVGIPPMLYLSRALHAAGHVDATAIFGATTAELMPVEFTQSPARDDSPTACVRLPGEAPYPALLTTDDGSLGLAGRVTDGLRFWHARLASGTPTPSVYACGPEPMLAAVARLTRELGCDCELCIEKMMGCGLGTCLSCVVQVRDASDARGWRWALSCSEGPVFPRDALVELA